MEKGGQKGTHSVPSGIVGVVFEVGMKWEWVEGDWGMYQCEACSLDYGIQFVLPFSSLLPFKWQHGSGWYLFSLLQLVIDTQTKHGQITTLGIMGNGEGTTSSTNNMKHSSSF